MISLEMILTDLKDDLPITVADRVQLQQVLMNLMLRSGCTGLMAAFRDVV
jgi:phosphoglycerate-specific signal transduction histidine kinase